MFKIKFEDTQEVYDFMLDFYQMTGIEIINQSNNPNPFLAYWSDVQVFSLD